MIEVYKDNIDDYCRIGLNHELYHSEFWSMIDYYRDRYCIKLGLLYIIDNKPIGSCMLINSWADICTYVKPDYRLQGIGRKLVECAYNMMPEHGRCVGVGIAGSLDFYNKTITQVEYA